MAVDKLYGGDKMVSEAKKRANKKWAGKNICSLACRVKVADAEKFKKYCADRGQTSNAVLKAFVLDCIAEDPGESAPSHK